MANTVQNTFNKIGNTLESIFGGGGTQQPQSNGNNGGEPSALEMYGRHARAYHLTRNEWKKDLQYTRALVNSEYMIQTEFKIDGGSGQDNASPSEKAKQRAQEQAEKKAKKEAKKKAKEEGKN
jgi:hypothetical protein